MWRSANEVGELVDAGFGSWTRAELDEDLKNIALAETQAKRIAGCLRAAETRRAQGKWTSPPRGEFRCPECPDVLKTAAALGSHRQGVHGIAGQRSLRSA